jgi:hypothetical protein
MLKTTSPLLHQSLVAPDHLEVLLFPAFRLGQLLWNRITSPRIPALTSLWLSALPLLSELPFL